MFVAGYARSLLVLFILVFLSIGPRPATAQAPDPDLNNDGIVDLVATGDDALALMLTAITGVHGIGAFLPFLPWILKR